MTSRLVVIPARYGSKGIPRKVVRSLGGEPLISHCLKAVTAPLIGADVVVSTDDPDVVDLVKAIFPSVTLLARNPDLCGDSVTLDAVVYDCASRMIAEGRPYTSIVTVQPTSPFVRSESIREAFEVLESGVADTVLSVKREQKLKWRIKEGDPIPLYTERVNRQYIEPEFVETGAVIGCTSICLSESRSRIGKRVRLVELSGREALDIDDPLDWMEAEAALGQRRIAVITVGSVSNGMGHAYRVATIASDLAAHNLQFFCAQTEDLAINYLRERNYPVTIYESRDELMAVLRMFRPDVIINDCLDTDRQFVETQKTIGQKVICFEDLGGGARVADALINELYPPTFDHATAYSGPAYACLRDEFFWMRPTPREERKGILITFGGADEGNLTLKCLRWLRGDQRFDGIRKVVVLGKGYRHWSELEHWMTLEGLDDIEIIRDTRHMSQLMTTVRVGICSGGRTVYEYFACETPTVVICQNARELTHLFLKDVNGVRNFGLYADYYRDEFLSAVLALHDNDDEAGHAVASMDSARIKAGRGRIRHLIVSDTVSLPR